MNIRTALRLAAAIAITCALCVAKEKPPTQPDMARECVHVTEIHSSSWGNSLSALVHNRCPQTMAIVVTIGYFNSRGVQYGDGTELLTLGSGAYRKIWHQATDSFGWRWSRVIAITPAPL